MSTHHNLKKNNVSMVGLDVAKCVSSDEELVVMSKNDLDNMLRMARNHGYQNGYSDGQTSMVLSDQMKATTKITPSIQYEIKAAYIKNNGLLNETICKNYSGGIIQLDNDCLNYLYKSE
jgi:hypothetical protein